jgi:hypothetical protein
METTTVNRHWDEGALQALLDGGLPPGERAAAEAHVSACADCAAALKDLRGVNDRARSLLASADVPAPVAQAQMALRARRVRVVRPSGWTSARDVLLRAAVIVLGLTCVAGVAAAAVPGLPLHAWIVRQVRPAAKTAVRPAPRPAPVAAPASAKQSSAAGVSIHPDAGAVRVVLTGASPRLTVTARLVDGSRAGVLARGGAASGARFRTAPGRIEVVDAGAGELQVDLPRDAHTAQVEVNGRVYVERDGDALRVLAPSTRDAAGPSVRVGP